MLRVVKIDYLTKGISHQLIVIYFVQPWLDHTRVTVLVLGREDIMLHSGESVGVMKAAQI